MSKKIWAEIAKTATKPQREVELCLRGDLIAKRATVKTDEESEALEQEIKSASVLFVLEGLSRQDFRALEAQHPAEDEDAGWNLDTFPEALVRASLSEPVIEDGEPFFELLTGGQVEALFEAAFKASVEVDAGPLL